MSDPTPNAGFRPGPFRVPRVALARFQRFQIEAWAAQAYPLAVCGLLLGVQEGDNRRVVAARLAQLGTVDQRAAEAEARALGLAVVGTWRSKPDAAPVPEATDRERAAPSWSHVLVAVDRHAERELRAWRFEDGHFVEEEVAS
ncbi:MAG: Mov34/MPN/PAD-1 family protein [Planctomycetes bacterium]|nr:Mov34/MPN/PAD-1 family protein [Planctomycetota bacterium]